MVAWKIEVVATKPYSLSGNALYEHLWLVERLRQTVIDMRNFLRDRTSSGLYSASDIFCIKKRGIAEKAISVS